MPSEPSLSAVGTGPLVSAIVSTYNAERFIRGCLEDLEAQTIADRLEIVVVDSGSPQNESTIVREFQQRYDNIQYIRTAQREGLYAAWNRGIQAARGTYITNANTDDRHKRDAFERMVAVLETRPDIALVYADTYITETENETFDAHTLVACRAVPAFDPLELIYRCYIGPQPMWRKSVHTKYGSFDESFESAGDWEFWLRIAETETFLHLPEFLGLYLLSPTSVEHRNYQSHCEEMARVHQRYLPRVDRLKHAGTGSGAAEAKQVISRDDHLTQTGTGSGAAVATPMTIKAYQISDRAAVMQPAAVEQDAVSAHGDPSDSRAMRAASGIGWVVRCPYAVELTWSGGPAPEDIAIRIEAPDADAPPFVHSYLGAGLVSFYPGYQFQTEAPHNLWVRGPINQPKDGLYPLEQIVETALLPCTITVIWQCMRPHQTVRFEQGEPFATILPYASSAQDVTLDVVPLDDEGDLDAYEQAFQQFVDSAAVQSVFQRLGAVPAAITLTEQTHDSKRTTTASAWATQLTDPPPVSCICPTYGRVALLEEAIEAFLRQDYPGPKELIILNDYAGQTLEFEHPEVHIVNVPQRFSSVGEKYQAAVARCTHDLIVVWHDDDIYLPHRLSLSVAHFDHTRGFFKASSAWFWNDGQLSGPASNTFHGGSCFSRELFTEARGYPYVGNTYDIAFELLCENLRAGATKGHQITPEDVYYIYRWAGTNSYHLSLTGQHDHTGDAVAAHVREQAERGQIKRGRITLEPHWKTDYTALVRDYLGNDHAKPAKAGAFWQHLLRRVGGAISTFIKDQFSAQRIVPPQVALTPEYWIKEISRWPDGVTKSMQLHYLFLTAGDAARAEEARRQAAEHVFASMPKNESTLEREVEGAVPSGSPTHGGT